MTTTATFRNLTDTVTVKLVTETCCNCGVVFAMTEAFTGLDGERAAEASAVHPRRYQASPC